MNASLRVVLTALFIGSAGCAPGSVGSLPMQEPTAGDPVPAAQAEPEIVGLPSLPRNPIDPEVQPASATPSPVDAPGSIQTGSSTSTSPDTAMVEETRATWTPSAASTDTWRPTLEATKLGPTWTPSVIPTHTPAPDGTATLATATPIASTTAAAGASTTVTPVDPGLVVHGVVRLPGGSGVADVVICRRLAGYEGVPVAVTDDEGEFTGEYEYIPGDEMITVWPFRGGYVFEPESVYWRHYHGLEITNLEFIAYAFFPTPTHTPSLTTTPSTVTGTPTPTKTPQIVGGDCRGG